MTGVVFDINVQGHRDYLFHLIAALDLTDYWDDLQVRSLTIPDLGYGPETADRIVWTRCQTDRLVLVTENRNDDGEDSLERTIADSLTADSLPVLTLANKGRFEHDRRYALIVAEKFLDTLMDISAGRKLGIGRLYLPSRAVV